MNKKRLITVINIIFINVLFSAQLKTIANPCMRTGAQMITDSLHQRIILFGGGNDRLPWGRFFNDVWVLDLNTRGWVPLNPSGTLPPPRFNHSVAYYHSRNKMILFGGVGETHYNDVWTLDLTPGAETWTRILPSGTSPQPLSGATIVIDYASNRLILFGGEDGRGAKNDVWELNIQTLTWQQLNPTGSLPPPRFLHRAVYDPDQNKMIIFGGTNSSIFYGDIWSLDLTSGSENWQQLYPSGNPPGERCGFFGDYAAPERMVIGFGWKYSGGFTYYNDVWILHLNNLTWERIYPTDSAVEGRRGPCGAYDPYNEQIIIFGGDQYSDYYLDDTYAMTLNPVFVQEQDGNSKRVLPYLKIDPNPFRIPCHINAFVPVPSKITLKIIDVSGRIVKTLIQDQNVSGNCIITWDGKNDVGDRSPNGIYFVNFELNNIVAIEKTVLIE